MKLPAAAYSAFVATSATKAEAAGYLAKFSEAATLLRQGYEGSPRLHPRSVLRGIRRRRITTNSWTPDAVLLACVALGDLASYEDLTLGVSDAQRIHRLIRKDDGHDETDCKRSTDRLYGDNVQVGVTAAFTIVKSDVFIRFNLRRQV
jgi:hypothetical protein